MPFKDIQKRREYIKQWKKNNPEKIKRWAEKYRQENKEKIKEYSKRYNKKQREKYPEKVKQWTRDWKKKNKKLLKEYDKRWRKNNREKYLLSLKKCNRKRSLIPKNRVNNNIGTLIWYALKKSKNRRSWEKLVGYTLEELIKHLEKQFDDKMNWNNYGSYWSIDHIKPRSLFHYETAEDLEFKECWALRNLQPIEKIENIKKGNKF